MEIQGLPIIKSFKASVLAEKYQIELPEARVLKIGKTVVVDNAIGERLCRDKMAKAVKSDVSPIKKDTKAKNTGRK